VAANPPEV
jgi:secondary thiamine-phosphate synthase enzyme